MSEDLIADRIEVLQFCYDKHVEATGVYVKELNARIKVLEAALQDLHHWMNDESSHFPHEVKEKSKMVRDVLESKQ
jgi:hypothetical protein